MARSTAHRLLQTLVYRQFAQQAPDRSYRPGPVLLALQGHSPTRTHLLDVATPFLDQVVQQSAETCHLAVLAQREVRFLASMESDQILRIGSRAGQVMPAHRTAAGKALLAELPAAELEQLFPVDSADFAQIVSELRSVRRRGFAVNKGGSERGVCAVAVAIRVEGRPAPGSLTVSVPSVRFSNHRIPELHQILARAAAEISGALQSAPSRVGVP